MEKKVSVWQATLNSGLILGFVLVIYTLLLYFLDQTFNRSLGLVSILIIIIGLVLGIKSFRDDARGGIMSYGQGIGAGTVIGLYAGIIGAIFTFLLYEVIDPDLVGKLLTVTEERFLESGRFPEEMMDQMMERQKKLMTPWIMSIGAIINYVFFGVVISLIACIFLKKEGTPFQQEATEPAEKAE